MKYLTIGIVICKSIIAFRYTMPGFYYFGENEIYETNRYSKDEILDQIKKDIYEFVENPKDELTYNFDVNSKGEYIYEEDFETFSAPWDEVNLYFIYDEKPLFSCNTLASLTPDITYQIKDNKMIIIKGYDIFITKKLPELIKN